MFNSRATSVVAELGESQLMLNMTALNKWRFKDFINDPTRLEFRRGTDFYPAFDLAFDALESTAASDCHNVILFMTDGVNRGAMDPLQLIRTRNGGAHGQNGPPLSSDNARIFTYSFGSAG